MSFPYAMDAQILCMHEYQLDSVWRIIARNIFIEM